MEKVVDVTIARRRFGTLLDEVFHRGDTFTIKRKGKALAQIVPIEGYPSEQSMIRLKAEEKAAKIRLQQIRKPQQKTQKELAQI